MLPGLDASVERRPFELPDLPFADGDPSLEINGAEAMMFCFVAQEPEKRQFPVCLMDKLFGHGAPFSLDCNRQIVFVLVGNVGAQLG